MIVIRNSPVKIRTMLPAYAPNPTTISTVWPSTIQLQSFSQPPSIFSKKNPGFGSCHVFDKAPFSLWDSQTKEFRYPSEDEFEWISKEFNAGNIIVELPDIIIHTNQPPTLIPLTVACALARFVPLDVDIRGLLIGSVKPYGTTARPDLLPCSLKRYTIPSHNQSVEIISLLSQEMDIRAVHFLPPHVIVELDVSSRRVYERKTLPHTMGGLTILYHESEEEWWKGVSQKAYKRLVTPTDLATDNSDYLFNNPHELSPGVCILSNYLQSDQWLSTSRGVLVQRGVLRYMAVANHGFPASDKVFHPAPTGCQVGQVIQRFPDLDLALVQLDPSVSFSNKRYFAAPIPLRLTLSSEVRAGDWFEVDGMSAGRVDLCVRGMLWYNPETSPASPRVKILDWKIETAYSLFGTVGPQLKEGICGAPIVNEDRGRVSGLFCSVD